jgi:hypothetical protein
LELKPVAAKPDIVALYEQHVARVDFLAHCLQRLACEPVPPPPPPPLRATRVEGERNDDDDGDDDGGAGMSGGCHVPTVWSQLTHFSTNRVVAANPL